LARSLSKSVRCQGRRRRWSDARPRQQALAAATTIVGDFPLLAAELRAQTEAGGNPTLLDVARQIDAVDKSTRIALAAIKLRRRRAKIVIRAAADVGAMQSALTGAAQTA